MVIRRRYIRLLESLGLATLDAVRVAGGELIKNQHGKRDVIRLCAGGVTFYLKRVKRTKAAQTLESFVWQGRLRSLSGIEWDNMVRLRRGRVRVAEPIAFGEEIYCLRERFSFIITRAAPGEMDLRDFVERERDPLRRRRILKALAVHVRRFHDAGFATPDLFARHLFVQWRGGRPRFTMIDVQRLNHRRRISRRMRARDLAGLNSSLPNHLVSPVERMRFLYRYVGGRDRHFFLAVRRRMEHLLRRNKRLSFYLPAPRTS